MTQQPPSPYGVDEPDEMPDRDGIPGRDATDAASHPAEADVVTPARGVPAAVAPPPTAARPRLSRARVATLVALVVGLLGTAWVSTDYLRTVWPGAEPRRPVTVDSAGVASLAGVSASLVEAIDLGRSPSLPGTDWQPPAGFHAWRVVLETTSTNPDLLTCEVAIVDSRGRQFWANYFVDSFVEGYEWSYTCGVTEPEDEIGPEQALLVLVPADAEPQTVRIWALSLNPDYIELEID